MGKKRRMVLIASLVMGMTAGSVAAVTLAGCKPKPQVVIEDVTGAYYGEANGKGCEIELDGTAFTFNLTVDGVAKQGEYSYDGSNLNLTFSDSTVVVASLTKSGDEGKYVLNITYNGTDYSLGEVEKYAVNFKDGGNVLSTVKVIEGKKAIAPVAPSKSGYAFVGWYEDNSFGKAFDFSTKTITGATDIYARYIEVDASKRVYTVKFHTDEGVTAPADVQTVNGIVYNLPTPVKSGATFAGWWVSSTNDANKPTYKYEGQELTANTTLIAVWDTGAPLVSVTSEGITWTAKGVNNSYKVVVTLPDGTEDNLGNLSVTSYEYDFSAAGEYKISITLRGLAMDVYYSNKGLAKVSSFNVEGNVLKFEGVENAQKYSISVECGNSSHSHTNVELEGTQYDFSSCEMRKGGIKFVVTAMADGYVSSQSEEFVLERNLNKVQNFTVDQATDTVKWDAVENAVYYVVEIKQGEKTDKFNVTAANAANGYSLNAYSGEIELKIYPVAAGYNSPEAAEYSYNKVKLAVPQNLTNNGLVLSWSEVPNAKGYIVKVGDTVVGEVTDTSYTLTDAQFTDGIAEISVSAKGTYEYENSLFSTALTINKRIFSAPPTYLNGNLSWGAVLDAAYYEVKVNDGEPFRVEDATTSKVVLTQKGDNQVSVRCVYKEGGNSDWNSVTVNAYSVKVNKNNGEDTLELFKAANDEFDLQDASKQGYTFTGWYDSAESGKKYDNVVYPAADLELFAYYTANKYTITLKADVNSSLEQQTVEVTFGEDFTLPIPECTDPMKTFGGWRIEAGGSGTQYTDPEGNSSRAWNLAADTDLYVSWIDVFKFNLSQNGKEYSVVKGVGMNYATSVKVPAYYNDLPVTSLMSGAFEDCKKLKSIQIPNTIQLVAMGSSGGNYAGSAFKGCSALESISVYEVEGFNAATALYRSDNGVLIFNNPRTNLVEIVHYPYAKQGAYTIPDYVTSIPAAAFKSTSITEVVIPASVISIGAEAFGTCYKLEKITFLDAPEGTEEAGLTIAKEAFEFCKLLESITLPKRLVSFEFDSFNYCDNLKKLDVVSGGTFSSDDGVILKEIEGGKSIYFCPRKRETSYVISSPEIKAISDSAFEGCKSITSMTIPEWVVSIGKSSFKGCTALETLVFEGVDGSSNLSIDESAFYGCVLLKDLVLPANLTSLGKNAFGDIPNLTHVTVNCTREEITYSNNAFETTGNSPKTYVTELTLGPNVGVFDINGVFGSTSLQKITVDPANTNYADEDGVLYNKDYTRIVYYPNGKEGAFTIRDTVQEIGAGVFKGKSNIVSVKINKNVTLIGEGAFEDCENLTELIFEDGEAELNLDKAAFAHCISLTQLNLPTRLRVIGDEAFFGVLDVENIVIPEGVTTIGHKAFGMDTINSKLKTFHISSTVTSIAEFTQDELYKNSNAYWYNRSKTYQYVNGNIDIFFDTADSLGAIFRGADFEKITVAEGNPNYGAFNGVLCKKEEGKLTQLYISPMANKTENGVLEIPATITKLGDMAFFNSKFSEIKFLNDANEDGSLIAHELSLGGSPFPGANAEKITLPQGITSIPEKTFFLSSKLVEINIPNTVTSIGDKSFGSCSALTTIKFEEGGTEPLTVSATKKDTGVFSGCSALSELNLPDRIVIGNYSFTGLAGLTHITIPAGVESIGDYAFYGCKKLVEVNFAEGSKLKSIGNYAFAGSSNKDRSAFTAIILPDSLETIGNYAFNYTNLQSISIPASVTTIGKNAFEDSSELESVTFADNSALTSIGNNAFDGVKKVTEYDLTKCGKLTTIGSSAFLSNLGLTSVVIPASVTEIGASAFSGCTYLTNVTFATAEGKSAVASIGANCFQNTGLTEIVFPESTATQLTLGTNMFNSCKELTKVTLSSSIASIDNVFANCFTIKTIVIPPENTSLKADENAPLILSVNGTSIKFAYGAVPTEAGTYRIPEGITEISASAFKNQKGIKKLILPKSLTKICAEAFNGCHALEEVEVPADSNLEEIARKAFYNCFSLSKFAFTSNLKFIGTSAFQYCLKLTEAHLPEGFTSLGQWAFANSGVQSVTIPSTLVWEEDSKAESKYSAYCAFEECGRLTSVTLAEGLTWLGEYMFDTSGITEITIPASVTTLKQYVFQDCLSLAKATINCNVTPDTSTSPKDKMLFDGCTSLKEVKFGTGVSCVTNFMFNDCTALESIDLTGITTFGQNVFNGCTALSSVTLDPALSALGNYMFKGCTALTAIDLPDTISHMGVYTFQNSGLTSITIPSGVTMLKKTATGTTCSAGDDISLFKGCANLTSVILPVGLTKTGASIFADCPALTTVKYKDADGSIKGNDGELTLPSNLVQLGNSTFANTGFTTVKLPATVSTVGTNMFKGCLALTSANVESTVTNTSMFEGCELLTTVVLNDKITEIKGSMFKGCAALVTVKTCDLTAGTFTGEDNKVELPSALTTIGSYCFQNSGIKEVKIPEKVTKLDNYTFAECLSLVKVTVGSKLATINKNVFEGCTALTEVAGADGLKTLGNYAFQNCEKLQTINLSALTTMGTYAFQNCTSLETADLSKATSINTNAFDGCSALATVTLNDAITKFGNYAFRGTTALTSITLPSKLTTTGTYTFQNSGLTSITLPEGVTTVGNYMFDGCANLSQVTLGSAVSTINKYAFSNCTKLTFISLPSTVTTLGENAFRATGLVSIDLPASITSIGSQCFLDCADLERIEIPASATLGTNIFAGCKKVQFAVNSGHAELEVDDLGAIVDKTGKLVYLPNSIEGDVVLPEGITSIGSYALNACKATSITVPSTLTSVDKYAFFNYRGSVNLAPATGLTELGSYSFNNYGGTAIEIPTNITTLGQYSFKGCTNLKSVTVHGNLESISTYVFQDCTSLETVIIEEGITEISNYMFEGCSSLANVTLPSTLVKIGTYAFQDCTSLTEIVLPDNVATLSSSTFKNCTGLTKVTLPKGLIKAETSTFTGCTAIKEVVFPDGITYIPSFSNTAIETVTLPSTAETITTSTFSGCANLTSVTIPEGVTSVVSSMFKNCVNLKNVNLPSTITSIGANAFEGAGITGINLPTGLLSIGEEAFLTSGLTQVSLPEGLQTIGESAFSGLPLTEIVIPSTVTSVGGSAFKECAQLATITIKEGEGNMVFGTYVFAFTAVKEVSLHGKIATSATVLGINTGMFDGCANLEKVTLAEGATIVDDNAFRNCAKLNSINLPLGITEIGSDVFENCLALKTVTIPASMYKLWGAFTNWTSEQKIVVECYALDGSDWSSFCFSDSNAQYEFVCINPVYVQAETQPEGN